jgi:hypothetical protein
MPTSKPSAQPRDFSKYVFEGVVLGKGRLVLALVKRYAADHPGVDFPALREAFPDNLQAESPVQFSSLRCVVAPLDKLSPAEQKRFFVGVGEPTRLADGTKVAVSSQWNRFNIRHVLERAEALGYPVVASQRRA